MSRRALLICGVLSSLVYVGIDQIAALRHAGYHDFASQTISELGARGSPTKALVDPLFILTGMGFGAFALGPRFRVYSIASMVATLGFGALTSVQAKGLVTGDPTPWIGLTERLCIGAFLVWVGVLAVTLLRAEGAWAERREVHA